MGQDRPLLVLENLSIGYNAVLASEISARINAGEVIAVLGPSGVGKTTLVRTIAGLIEPIGGRVELHAFFTHPSVHQWYEYWNCRGRPGAAAPSVA